jgi:TIR domain
VADAQIFISYARDDDIPPPHVPGGKGFVTFLREQLEYEFRDRGPTRPTMWVDIRGVGAADLFEPAIDQAINDSALFIAVLSPNWMSRDFCRRELNKFAERWSHEGSEGVKHRIIVVNKRPVEPDRRPSQLQGQVGYTFYTLDGPELDQAFFRHGQVVDTRYFECLRQMVAYLSRRTARLLSSSVSTGVEPAPPVQPVAATGRTVFVAKPAGDMRQPYDRVVTELTGQGYSVVPDPAKDIPPDSSAVEFIDQALAIAEVSIHLLGEKLGSRPDEELAPILKLQLARAAEWVDKDVAAGKTPAFRRIIWAPKVLDRATAGVPEGDQPTTLTRNPVEVLTKFDRQLNSDKIDGKVLSKFVDFLTGHLVNTAPELRRPARIEGGSRVYLYHSPEDTDYVFNLADKLQERHVEAVLPVFEGPDSEIKSFHRKNLSECDAVALCWAKAPEVWVRAGSSELRDWHRLGRTHQFAYRGVVAGPPPGTRKSHIKTLFPASEIDVIVDLTDKGSLTPEMLDPLVPAASPPAL